MRTRVVWVIPVLSRGLTTRTLARPRADNPSQQPTTDPQELSRRVARLRAEGELLQVKHDAARTHFLGLIKRVTRLSIPPLEGCAVGAGSSAGRRSSQWRRRARAEVAHRSGVGIGSEEARLGRNGAAARGLSLSAR
jgi:hypothetical protein